MKNYKIGNKRGQSPMIKLLFIIIIMKNSRQKIQSYPRTPQNKAAQHLQSQDSKLSGIQQNSSKKNHKLHPRSLPKISKQTHSDGDSLSMFPSPLLSESISFNNSLEESLEEYLKLHYQNGKTKSGDIQKNSSVQLAKTYLSQILKTQTELQKHQDEERERERAEVEKKFLKKTSSLGEENAKKIEVSFGQKKIEKEISKEHSQANSVKPLDTPKTLRPQIKQKYKNETAFGKALKISQRISFEGQLLDSDFQHCNLFQPLDNNNIQFLPHLWHNPDQQPVYIRQSLKKQRPPLMEHSSMNYQSSGSYLPEQNQFRYSDFEADNNRQSISYELNMKKTSSNKVPSFKESEILKKHSQEQQKLNPTESVMETLQNFHKKIQKEKKQQMYIINADSSSEEDDSGDKIMALSNKKESNQIPEKEATCYSNILKAEFMSRNTLEPIKEHAQQCNNASQIHSRSSGRRNLEYTINEQMRGSRYRVDESRLPSNSFSDIVREIQNKYIEMMNELKEQYTEELMANSRKIQKLQNKIFSYEGQIKKLENKNREVEKSKEELSMKLLVMSLQIQEHEQQGTDTLNSFSISATKKLKMENQETRKILQQKDELIYTLSRELELLNSRNSQFTSIASRKKKGMAIQFIDRANQYNHLLNNTSALCNCQFTYSNSMEEIILMYEKNILKNIQMIKAIQKCLEESIKELFAKQNSLKIAEQTIKHLLKTNQSLEKNQTYLKRQFILLAEAYQKSKMESQSSDNVSKNETSSNQFRNGDIQVTGRNRLLQMPDNIFSGQREISNCSTIKI